MNKKEWMKLANGFLGENGYWSELYSTKRKIAEKYGLETDFLGVDYFAGPLTSAVEELLGEDFLYWCFDCEKDFDDFNKRIEHVDGTHPDVHSLDELYDYSTSANGDGGGQDA